MNSVRFWAKLDQKIEARFHPLLWHMVDVALCAKEFVNHKTKIVQSQILLESTNCDDISVVAWLVGLHDLGKCSPVFQGISDHHRDRLAAQGLSFPTINARIKYIRHNVISKLRIREYLGRIGLDPKVARTLASIISGHHGLFPSADERDVNQAAGDGTWSTECSVLADFLASMLGISNEKIVEFFSKWPRTSPQLEAILAGLTTHSDWIGSQSDKFPFGDHIESPREYFELSAQRARTLAGTMRRQVAASASFEVLFSGKSPRPLQEAVIHFTAEQSEPFLLIVEAPMGEGKTEAAMWGAYHASQSLGSTGTYFALPTEATSNQMFGRVIEFLRATGESAELHLAHGHAEFVDDYAKLKSFTAVYDSDSARADSLSASEWFCKPKRKLLAQHGVGTVDQALISILQTKHFFLRLYGLCGKTVIIDEIHAYDDYTESLLERLLGWLSAMKCCVIVLSATLPRERRAKLLAAYVGHSVASVEASYPRISWVTAVTAGSSSFSPSDEQRRKVTLQWLTDDPETLAGQAAALANTGGRVAVICNTVGRAQQVSKAISTCFPDQEAHLLHARFPLGIRRRKEAEYLRRFGNNGENERSVPAILVGTQVLEQSLDLDFDVMISDLAPVDLILQRMGRLHRHKRFRVEAHCEPRFLIASGPDVENPNLYDRYLMAATKSILAARLELSLPEDIEPLVETIYLEQESDVAADLIDMYRQWKKEREALRARARKCMIPAVNRRDAHVWDEWMTSGLEEDEPEMNPHLQALTRAFEPSITVVCLEEGEPIDAVNREQTKALLLNSVRISHRGLIYKLKMMETPSEWKARAVLRYMKLLRFTEGVCEVGDWRIINDSMLGLVIESIPREDTE